MVVIALVGWVGYVAVAFVLRSWLQIRSTGSSGFVGLRRGASWIERGAGAAMVAAFGIALVAPLVGQPLADTSLLGVILLALATMATFAAQVAMRASWRIGVDPSERTELVTSGPFAWVRNPIFTAMIAASVGLALACPTPLALVAPPLLCAALEIQVRVVEEPYLVHAHGAAYLDYATRVGRFVPGVGRLRAGAEPGSTTARTS